MAQPVADERDAERLEWVSHAWGGQRHDYANHVLSRGGDGDLSDIRTFIDKHLPARAALCQPAEEEEEEEGKL
ncbi:hypothetical protein [Herbaspirillum aquaticum]|uniref:Uncharacterized protein n=1 Tax=Herbaspirillum aquaticum TaxID=568783 RepID=A0A225SP24_9BURK|nr:hypothetical protein [Herbaspirillum aquaticum]OWY32492.1 hypothetical protein CEJ45_20795 [Herbaspirillum aquaticum]